MKACVRSRNLHLWEGTCKQPHGSYVLLKQRPGSYKKIAIGINMFNPQAPPLRNNDSGLGVVVGMVSFWLVFAFAWAVAGLVALFWSLSCFGRSGSTLDKVVGLLVALFLGPLFFMYQYFNKPYCR